MDFCLVTTAILDSWILSPMGTGGDSLRVVSVFRLMRLLRLLRLLRAFKELQLVVNGLLMSVKTVSWVGLLLFLLFYAFGVVITHNIGKGTEEDARRHDMWDYTYGTEFDRIKFWGSVLRSMLTLFLISTLEGWEDVTRPIVEARPYYAFIFLFFIAIAAFGVLNIVVGVITESTFKIARTSEKAEMKKRLKAERRAASSLRAAFDVIDADGRGTISEGEFEKALKQNQSIRDLLQELHVPKSELREIFSVMDPDGSGEVDVEEFIKGFMKIKEHNSATEQLGAYLRIQAMQTTHNELASYMAEFRRSQDRLAELLLPQPINLQRSFSTPRGENHQRSSSANGDATPRSALIGDWRKAKDQMRKASAQRLEIRQDGRADPLAQELGRQIGRTLEDRIFDFAEGGEKADVSLTDGRAAKTMVQFAELVEDLLQERTLRTTALSGGSQASNSPGPGHAQGGASVDGGTARSHKINGAEQPSGEQKEQSTAHNAGQQGSASDGKTDTHQKQPEQKQPETKPAGPEKPFAAVMGAKDVPKLALPVSK